ncbi:MAG: HpaII family restriction endonuclease [Bacteroidales bacterium]|nr:HpaII family restriction endonuclease [Bacteroidales bacterium]
MAIWEFNRGEWTEAYVFLRLLGKGRIYGATTELVKDDSTYIDIVNIIRDEPDKLLIFERFVSEEIPYVQLLRNGEKLKIVTAPEFNDRADHLYKQLKELGTGKRKISIPEIQKYLEGFKIDSPKANLSSSAKQKYGTKTDIIVTSENSIDNMRTTGGFSIKSHIGSSPTLFNSSQTSGFIYKVVGCNEKGMHQLNAKDSLMDIISGIRDEYSLEYAGCRNKIFEQNIHMVDSRMDEIMQCALLLRVGYFQNDSSSAVASTCKVLAEKNPLNVNNPQAFYTSKLKSFLFASFAGMTASEEWSGRKLLTGGYIDVDKDGEMLYYRAMSDDVFENYLYQHTYFDRPDRGELKELAVAEGKCFLKKNRPLTNKERKDIIAGCHGKKGDFGYVYKDGDSFYIAINFQIRFR